MFLGVFSCTSFDDEYDVGELAKVERRVLSDE